MTPSTITHHTRSFIRASAFLIIASASAQAQETTPTQTPTPAPTAEEIRLKEENRILELRKTNAELKKDIREAQPKPTATPLEGKTTLDDNVVIESHLVTYKAMSNVAEQIAFEIHKRVQTTSPVAIAIHGFAS